MSETEFAVYREGEIVRYAEENVKAGYWSPVEALDRAREANQRLIPDGLKTKNHIFFKIEDAKQDCRVGTIWLCADFSAAQPTGFIYDIFIEERFRHKGYGKQAMLTLEGKARELGLNLLALLVLAHSLSARALYEALGYQVKSMNMTKAL